MTLEIADLATCNDGKLDSNNDPWCSEGKFDEDDNLELQSITIHISYARDFAYSAISCLGTILTNLRTIDKPDSTQYRALNCDIIYR